MRITRAIRSGDFARNPRLLAVAAPIASLLVASHWSRVRFGQSWMDRRAVPGRAISELIELMGASGSAP
ncbi:MAG: hypothetical protein ACKOTD_10040, partial [Phycisphaerales bacterium]